MHHPTKLSIIIPVFNEENTIKEVVARVFDANLPGLEREIIIVDDGSTDNSPIVIEELKKIHPGEIKTHTSFINFGKGAAVRIGFKLATGDIILIQDADLETNPEDYPSLIVPILNGETDVVYGSRFLKQTNKVPFRIRFSNWFLTFLTNILYGSQLTDMATHYKVIRRKILTNIHLRSARFEFEPEITIKLLLAGYKIVELPVSYSPRRVDEGKKIGWIDGIEYIYTIFKYRFFE